LFLNYSHIVVSSLESPLRAPQDDCLDAASIFDTPHRQANFEPSGFSAGRAHVLSRRDRRRVVIAASSSRILDGPLKPFREHVYNRRRCYCITVLAADAAVEGGNVKTPRPEHQHLWMRAANNAKNEF
jgi:hypothetical protein